LRVIKKLLSDTVHYNHHLQNVSMWMLYRSGFSCWWNIRKCTLINMWDIVGLKIHKFLRRKKIFFKIMPSIFKNNIWIKTF
jgi:hypothetical protein